MRRFRTLPGDFDARCYGLEPVQDQWDDQVKKLHGENQARTIEGLKAEFGVWGFERKLADFIAIGVKPFSVQSYHNAFFDQTRRAFVQGPTIPHLSVHALWVSAFSTTSSLICATTTLTLPSTPMSLRMPASRTGDG